MNEDLPADRSPAEDARDRLGLLPLSSPRLTTLFEKNPVDETLLGGSLTFRGEALGDAIVFNDLTDEDDYEILAPAPKRAPRTRLAPAITQRPDRASIRYRASGRLTAIGRKRLSDLRLFVDGHAGITLLDYRRHEPNVLVAEALGKDLVEPRSIFRPADIEKLDPGEAMALEASGSLKFSVTVSWADVYTNTLGKIASLLGGDAPVRIRVDTRATLTVPVDVEDEFLAVISRTESGDVRFSIIRRMSSTRGVRLRVSASAGLANTRALSRALSSFLPAYFGVPLERLRKILAKASIEQLTPSEREIVMRLIEQLGLTDELVAFERLRAFVDELETRAAEALQEVISERVRASFLYEYSRLEAEDDLINLIVLRRGASAAEHRKAVRRIYKPFIRGNLEKVIEAMKEDPRGYSLEQFLSRDRLLMTKSFGFTLGIGDWKIESKDTEKLDRIVRTDTEGRQLVVFKGLRRHREKRGSFEAFEWAVDFRADMSGYHQIPLSAHFDFGLHFLVHQRHSRLARRHLDDLLDLAVLWGVVAPERRDEILETTAHLKGRKVTALLQVIYEEEHLRRLVARVDPDQTDEIAWALGAVLPQRDVRKATAHQRGAAWKDLIEQIISGRAYSFTELHRAGAEIADRLEEPALAALEREAATGRTGKSRTPASVVADHPDLGRAWHRFAEGARLLSLALDSGNTHYLHIPEIVRELRPMWEHAWYVRALPAWFERLGRGQGSLHGMSRTFRLDYRSDDDEEESMILARP